VIRWVGPKHYRKGRLEMGRFWFTWSGWRHFRPYNIGRTRVTSLGPLSVFNHREPK
jgi:hypothetical protein